MQALARMGFGLALVAVAAMLSLPDPPQPLRAQEGKAEKKWVDVDGDPLPEGVIARVGSTRWRLLSGSRELKVSPDGRYASVVVYWGGLIVFDTSTGRRLFENRFSKKGVIYSKFLPDNETLFVASDEEFFQVSLPDFRVGNPKPLPKPWPQDPILSSDGDRILTEGARGELIWSDRSTGKIVDTADIGMRGYLHTVGDDLVLCQGKEFVMFDPRARRVCWRRPIDGNYGPLIAVSPDGKRMICTVWKDRNKPAETPLDVIDCSTGAKILDLDPDKSTGLVRCAAFSPDGGRIYLGRDDGEIRIRDATTGKQTGTLKTVAGLSDLTPSPDGKTLFALGQTATLVRIDLKTGETIPDPTLEESCEGFASETSVMLVRDRRLRVVDYRTRKELEVGKALLPETADPLWVSPDRSLIVANGSDVSPKDGPKKNADTVVVHDNRTGTTTGLGSQVGRPTSFVVTPDRRKLFVSGWEAPLTEYDLAASNPKGNREDPPVVLRCAVSPGGRYLLTAPSPYDHREGKIDIREIGSGKVVLRFKPDRDEAFSFAFSPDETRVAVGSGNDRNADFLGDVNLHDIRTGSVVASFPGHVGSVTGTIFSRDGRSIITTALDGTVRVWEVHSQQQRYLLPATGRKYQRLFLSPSGGLLATHTREEGILVHDLYGKHRPALPALTAAQASDACSRLTSADAKEAFASMRRLVGSPGVGVKAIDAGLKPAEVPSSDVVVGWLTELESVRFPERQAAQRSLRPFARELEGTLKKAREAATDADLRSRLDSLIRAAKEIDPAWLKMLRGIEVLEQIGTPEAKAVLERLAKGDGGSLRTREAKASLGRLK